MGQDRQHGKYDGIDARCLEAHGWPTEPAQLERQAVGAWAPNPVGRMGRVEGVASLVAFVASPLADYINGSNLRIDGGLDPTIS